MASILEEKPAVEHLRELKAQIDRYWALQFPLDKLLTDLYFQEQAILVQDTADPKRKRQFSPERANTGEAARIIDQIVSFYPEPPEFKAQLIVEGTGGAEEADNVGKALAEAFDQTNPPGAGDAPWSEGVFWQALLGRCVDFIVASNSYYHDFPYKGEDEAEDAWAKRYKDWKHAGPIPIMWRSLDPATTFPPSIGAMDDEVLSWKEVTLPDLRQMFSERELADTVSDYPKDRYQKVTLFCYSNCRFLGYSIYAGSKTGGIQAGPISVGGQFPDKMLRVVEHGLGRSAIRILPGETTGRKEPPYYFKSRLLTVVDLLRRADQQLSTIQTAAKMRAFPPVVMHKNLTAKQEGEGARADVKQYKEGDIWEIDAGDPSAGRPREDMAVLFQPNQSDDKELLIWTLDRTGKLTSATPVLAGEISPNTAAWTHNYAGEMSKHGLRPFTAGVINRARDNAESIMRATVAFGDVIPLAKLADKGAQRRTVIELDPEVLKKYQPLIAGTYEAKLPQNWRADVDEGIKLEAAAQHNGWPDQDWIAEKFFGITDLAKHFRNRKAFEIMQSQDIAGVQRKAIVDALEGGFADEKGMGMDEFAQLEGLPEPARSIIMQLAQRGQQTSPVAPGAASPPVPALTPQTAGANRAGAPFSALPGGPQPVEGYGP